MVVEERYPILGDLPEQGFRIYGFALGEAKLKKHSQGGIILGS